MMRRFYLLVVAVLAALVSSSGAQEKITFTTPVFTDPGASEFRLASASFNHAGHELRVILLEVEPGTNTFKTAGDAKALQCTYADTQADNIIKALNKADFTTTSLSKQLMQKCQADGKFGPGTITGAPQ
jgi:hypothetical protein